MKNREVQVLVKTVETAEGKANNRVKNKAHISKYLSHYRRFNPTTGDYDYYFPMEVKEPADKEFARLNGLEIEQVRLGFRCFEAILIPCKNTVLDENGKTVYVDTPSGVQHSRFLELIRDEMKWQDEVKQDGRCSIPDGNGGVKRCPCRVPNPDFVPGRDEGKKPKTLPVKCEGCVYEQFRQAHTTVTFSCLDHEDESGEVESYEAPAPSNYYEGERYERMREAFLEYVQEHNDKLTDLAELLTLDYNRSEAARELGMATSTAASRRELLKDLCRQFLDSTII